MAPWGIDSLQGKRYIIGKCRGVWLLYKGEILYSWCEVISVKAIVTMSYADLRGLKRRWVSETCSAPRVKNVLRICRWLLSMFDYSRPWCKAAVFMFSCYDEVGSCLVLVWVVYLYFGWRLRNYLFFKPCYTHYALSDWTGQPWWLKIWVTGLYTVRKKWKNWMFTGTTVCHWHGSLKGNYHFNHIQLVLTETKQHSSRTIVLNKNNTWLHDYAK